MLLAKDMSMTGGVLQFKRSWLTHGRSQWSSRQGFAEEDLAYKIKAHGTSLKRFWWCQWKFVSWGSWAWFEVCITQALSFEVYCSIRPCQQSRELARHIGNGHEILQGKSMVSDYGTKSRHGLRMIRGLRADDGPQNTYSNMYALVWSLSWTLSLSF